MNQPLRVRDLSVELGGLPVLRGIDLTVDTGEAVALLGGNGAGKSTLVRSILGLVPYQRGQVDLFGAPLRQFAGWSQLGYVPQTSTVGLSRAKVKEVVRSGLLANRLPFQPPRRSDRYAVHEALDTVGLADRAGDEMAHLSGGQQQRVLIARALVGHPRLLVLDEPVAGVDLEQQQVLAAVLTNLVQHGTAVLVVLHEIGPLTPIIDRAVVLREGRVVHDGAVPPNLQHAHLGGHEFQQPDHDHGLLDGAVDRPEATIESQDRR